MNIKKIILFGLLFLFNQQAFSVRLETTLTDLSVIIDKPVIIIDRRLVVPCDNNKVNAQAAQNTCKYFTNYTARIQQAVLESRAAARLYRNEISEEQAIPMVAKEVLGRLSCNWDGLGFAISAAKKVMNLQEYFEKQLKPTFEDSRKYTCLDESCITFLQLLSKLNKTIVIIGDVIPSHQNKMHNELGKLQDMLEFTTLLSCDNKVQAVTSEAKMYLAISKQYPPQDCVFITNHKPAYDAADKFHISTVQCVTTLASLCKDLLTENKINLNTEVDNDMDEDDEIF